MDKATASGLLLEAGVMLLKQPDVLSFESVGSSTVEGSEPRDVDLLVLVRERTADLLDYVEDLFPGYKLCMQEYADWEEHWAALRKGDVNLIVTTDDEWFEKSKAANRVVQLLKLTDKQDRVAVFRIVRDDMEVHEARAAGFAAVQSQVHDVPCSTGE